jgi:PKD repeat protein
MLRYFLLTIFTLTLSSYAFSQEANRVPGEILVSVKAGYDGKQLQESFNYYSPDKIELREKLMPDFNIYLFSFTETADNPMRVLNLIKQHPWVDIAQFNHQVQLRVSTPNDASFTQQWSLNNTGQNGGTVDADIDAVEAWDITTGGLTATGDTIVVAVIDGGFQLNHPDLVQNIYKNYLEIPGNGIDDDNNGYIDDINGWNAYNNNGTIPSDQHGTHVSGIIGARGNNSIGVSGVNWNVKIMTIAGSSGSEATVIKAYGYAATMRKLYNQTNGAKGAYVVSTNSSFGVDLGNPNNYPLWCAFYDTLGKYGVLSAGATANANYNVDTQGDIPTACPSNFLISVTNTTNTDAKNNNCGYGANTIDLGSPGTNIYNTVTGSSYANLTGTSMATPHVAGAIGLMYAAACSELIAESKTNPAVVATQMKQYLLNGTDPIPSMNGITVTGGRLNVHKALLNVLTYPCDPTAPPVANFSGSNINGCPGLTASFNNLTTGLPTSILWLFPGGFPSSSTLSNPTVVYNALGTYDVTLIATNDFGSDTLTLPNYVNVNTNGTSTFWTEDFETASNFSDIGWSTVSTSNVNWTIYNGVGGNGSSTKAARVNIFSNQNDIGARYGLITPSLDFTEHSNVQLKFKHAYRRRVTSVTDSLIVYVSVDGGNTFPYKLLTKGENGQGTLATSNTTSQNWVPSSSSHWCFTDNTPGCFTVDLSAFDGLPDVKVKFEIYSNGNNNFYLDDVELVGQCTAPQLIAPIANLNISKTTACVGEPVTFSDASTNTPLNWQWSVNGATPSTSTQPAFTTTFSTPGTYDVTLIVSNYAGADTLTITNAITINPTPAVPTITQSNDTLFSSASSGNQWFLNGNIINGATNTFYVPTANGNYTVKVTNNFGCSATSAALNYVKVGIENITANNVFNIYPNPAQNTLTIEHYSNHKHVSFELSDALGRTLQTVVLNNNTTSFDVSNLPVGIYAASIIIEGKRVTRKLVINR